MSDFVLTNSFDGIFALDLHGRVMLWNRSMERMFSKKRQEVLGKIATDVLPFEGISREIKRAQKSLKELWTDSPSPGSERSLSAGNSVVTISLFTHR